MMCCQGITIFRCFKIIIVVVVVVVVILTTYNHHRHTTVSPSTSRRSSTPAPASRGITAVQLRATPPRPAAGSLNPGTCRLVSYRGRELWRWPLHDHPLSVYRQATAPKLDGDAPRPHRHRILLLTSYFLLLTYLHAYGCSGSAEGSAGAKVQGVA